MPDEQQQSWISQLYHKIFGDEGISLRSLFNPAAASNDAKFEEKAVKPAAKVSDPAADLVKAAGNLPLGPLGNIFKAKDISANAGTANPNTPKPPKR